MANFRPQPQQKPFYDIFEKLCYSRYAWEVWADFVLLFAVTISNAVDRPQAPGREERYLQTISKYQPREQALFPQLAAETVMALEQNPGQDFLGGLYMGMGLGSHWKGQFFTPYTLCRAMAAMTLGDAGAQIDALGWVPISDPACGAGATLIAAVDELQKQGVNYQDQALFIGQDLDPVAAAMCYIQLSLLGCPGYICVGNTLTAPPTGHILFPLTREGLDVWIMPMFCSTVWHWRRVFALASESNTKRKE